LKTAINAIALQQQQTTKIEKQINAFVSWWLKLEND
jgi:hypothetical protein